MSISEQFALKVHNGQRHGRDPYRVHLKAVVSVLVDFGYQDEWLDAAWLHDVLKKQLVPFNDLRVIFGIRVAALVDACTGTGHTRHKRLRTMYEKIGLLPEAAILKVADRIAHVEELVPHSEEFDRYLSEHPDFTHHVARHAPFALRNRLDKEMKIRKSVRGY